MSFASLVTPPLRVEFDTPPRPVERSLDFGTPRPHSDPVPVTSDPVHSYPDVSRSPVTRRLSLSPSCRPHTDHLDHTLTDADQCEPALMDESRWSASDYFHRYPSARLDSTGNSAITQQRQPRTGVRSRCVPSEDAQLRTCNDDDASTLISSIRRDKSPCSAASLDGSVNTSSSLDSVSTNDDAAFRAGLAQLDANIARVQRRLQGSLSSPTSTRHSPHHRTT